MAQRRNHRMPFFSLTSDQDGQSVGRRAAGGCAGRCYLVDIQGAQDRTDATIRGHNVDLPSGYD